MEDRNLIKNWYIKRLLLAYLLRGSEIQAVITRKASMAQGAISLLQYPDDTCDGIRLLVEKNKVKNCTNRFDDGDVAIIDKSITPTEHEKIEINLLEKFNLSQKYTVDVPTLKWEYLHYTPLTLNFVNAERK